MVKISDEDAKKATVGRRKYTMIIDSNHRDYEHFLGPIP